MKCPRCWADKAYLSTYHTWYESVLGCLAFRPMKCSHCYHRFMVHWMFTIGKRIVPPVLRVTPHRVEGSARRDKENPPRRTAA
jgi:hypothetical protein